MQIYLGHSTLFDYQTKLYQPIKNSILWQKYNFILPHEQSINPVNSKAIINEVDLMIAEVSYPSIGLGIELAWANNAKRNILSRKR